MSGSFCIFILCPQCSLCLLRRLAAISYSLGVPKQIGALWGSSTYTSVHCVLKIQQVSLCENIYIPCWFYDSFSSSILSSSSVSSILFFSHAVIPHLCPSRTSSLPVHHTCILGLPHHLVVISLSVAPSFFSLVFCMMIIVSLQSVKPPVRDLEQLTPSPPPKSGSWVKYLVLLGMNMELWAE